MNTLAQPRALYPLSFTELWERFGYYVIQTIIVLYLTQGLKFSDGKAYILYGAFMGFLYLTPVLGGWIADRYLGFVQTIKLGGVLLILGYTLLATSNYHIFLLGLSIVAVGNGFFKPNISGIIGTLYKKDDARREGGFTIFYMGINIGALLPPLFMGYIQKHFGWHIGFLTATAGMLIGVLTFHLSQSSFAQTTVWKRTLNYKEKFIFIISLILITALIYGLLNIPTTSNLIIIIGSLAIMLWVLRIVVKQEKESRHKMLASIILILISLVFWSIYNETFSSLMLFAERNMSLRWLGLNIDAEFTQFYNPFFIFLLSPFLSALWVYLQRYQLNPSYALKFTIGLGFLAAGFLFLGVAAHYGHEIISPWWLVGSYGMQTITELLISPIGLSMITVLTPQPYVGMMMGVWFLMQAASAPVTALLANLADAPLHATKAQSLQIYSHAFIHYGEIALIVMIISIVLIPFINRMVGKIV